MLIIVGKKNIILNPACIVSFQLARGKATAFLSGEETGETIMVKDLTIREPWSVMINTTAGVQYINCKTFDKAMDELINVIKEVYRPDDKSLVMYRKEMEKRYGDY